MRKVITLLIIALLIILAATAQSTAKISGIVANGGGKGFSAATVSLLKAKDPSPAKLARIKDR